MPKTATRDAENEKLLKDMYYFDLSLFFQKVSTFEIRWRVTLLADYVSPAVTTERFLKRFTRKELARFEHYDLVGKTTHRETDGSLRSCIYFKAKILPQLHRRKAFLSGEWRTLKINWSIVYFITAYIALAGAIAFFIHLKHRIF